MLESFYCALQDVGVGGTARKLDLNGISIASVTLSQPLLPILPVFSPVYSYSLD